MSKWLLDKFDKKLPSEVCSKTMLALEVEELPKMPVDWMEFVMLAVGKNYDDAVMNSGGASFVNLENEAMTRAMKIIDNKEINLVILGHLTRGDLLWQLRAIEDKSERLFIGGENFRTHCDHENIFYRSFLDENGVLGSGSALKYLKRAGEDCRAAGMDFRKIQ